MKTSRVSSPDLQDFVGWESRVATCSGLGVQIYKMLCVGSPDLQDFVGWESKTCKTWRIVRIDLQDFVGCEDRLAKL